MNYKFSLNSRGDYDNQFSEKKEKESFVLTLLFIFLLILNYWVGNLFYSLFLVFYAVLMLFICDPIYFLVPCFLVDTIQSYFMVTESLSFNLVLVVLLILGFLLHQNLKIRFDGFDLLLLLFGFYNLLSSFLSVTGDYSPGVSLLLSIFVIILVRHYDHERIENVFSLLIITGILFSITIIIQTIASIRSSGSSQVVFDDTFNANTISGCISVLLAIVYGAIYVDEKRKKFFTYALVAVGAVTILFVGSRTALLALLSSVLLITIFSNKLKMHKKGKAIFSFIIIVCVLGFALWGVLENNDAIFNRFTFNDTSGVESITRRTDVWKVLTERIIPDNPVFGVGFGLMNVKTAVGKYMRYPKHAHNMILAIVSETGFVGAILFMIVFAYMIHKIIKYKSKFTPIVVGMIIVGFISGIGEEIIDRRWFWLIFAFGALAVNYAKINEHKKSDKPDLKITRK